MPCILFDQGHLLIFPMMVDQSRIHLEYHQRGLPTIGFVHGDNKHKKFALREDWYLVVEDADDESAALE